MTEKKRQMTPKSIVLMIFSAVILLALIGVAILGDRARETHVKSVAAINRSETETVSMGTWQAESRSIQSHQPPIASERTFISRKAPNQNETTASRQKQPQASKTPSVKAAVSQSVQSSRQERTASAASRITSLGMPKFAKDSRTAYLTFDDGPSSEMTAKVLDILKEKDVKATFFVVHNGNDYAVPLYKRELAEGHQQAVHGWTHDYKKVYRNKAAFMKEFADMQEFLYKITGTKPHAIRFPGGTSISLVPKRRIKEIILTLNQQEIPYYDWNVSAGDATKKKLTKGKMVQSVLKQASNFKEAVILMHDTNDKKTTLEALPDIIEGLKDMGYRFDVVRNLQKPVQHRQYPLEDEQVFSSVVSPQTSVGSAA